MAATASIHIDPRRDVTGLVLAGGRGRRFGGEDKGLLRLGDRHMIEHLIAALEPQVAGLLISANRNLERYRRFGWPVVRDADDRHAGPLAGVAAGLAAAPTEWVAVAPCDAPLVPPDLVARLVAALHDRRDGVAVAHDGCRQQHLFCLLGRSRLDDLRRYLASGQRSAEGWFAGLPVRLVDFSDCPENFRNVNRPEDRADLEAMLRRGPPNNRQA